jgi:Glycosyltransferase family 87
MTTLTPQPRRRWLAILLLILLGAFLVQRATRRKQGPVHRNRLFASLVWQGQSPYPAGEPIHAPYPPSYGFLMGPLLLPPIQVARITWAILQLFCLLLLYRLAMRWWETVDTSQFSQTSLSPRGPPQLVLLLSLLLVSRYLLRDMSGGGGNLIYGTLVALACIRPGEQPGEDKRPWLGIGLGLVLGLKPTPLLFLPWLAMRGRNRTLGVAILTALLCHIAPITTLGPDLWISSYTHWAEGAWLYSGQTDLFATPSHDFPPFTWMNQSLRCAVTRYLTTVPHDLTAEIPRSLFFQGIGLSAITAGWVNRLVSLSLLGYAFALLYRLRKVPSPWVEWGAPCLLIPLTLLLSPIAWKAHQVQLLPVFFFLLVALSCSHKSRRIQIGLILYFLLCTLPGADLVGKDIKEWMQCLYVVTLGGLWLFLTVAHSLWTPALTTSSRGKHPKPGS